MADHGELLAEMACVGRLSGPERVKHAQKRRAEQLKVWAEMEKDGAGVARSNGGGEKSKRVTFPTSVTLLEAAARNDLQEVRQLLGSGVDPDLYNEDGLTALHQSCIDDFVELAVCLLGAGASVNAVDSELWTPLHAAATCGHLELVQLLLDSGADLLAVNADRNMPFDLCEDQATLELLETLMAEQGVTQERIEECRAAAELEMLRELRGGADLTLRDQQGAGLLHVAAAHGFLRVAELLLERGMSPDQPDADGWTPLHAAVCWAKIQMVELLVAHGASLNARSELDETPLDVCTDEEVRTKLLELKHKHESIMRGQERHKNPLQRRVSSAGSRGKVVRRSSVLERSSLHRREQQKEARVWQERGREAELLDEDEDGQTDAELKMHTAAVPGGDDAASGAEPPLAVLGNGDTPTEPVPGDALSRERSQHTLADLKRQRAASKLLKAPAPPTPEPRPPAPPLQDVYFTPASGDPPLLKLRAPEEDVTSTKEPCCRLM